MTRWWVVEQCAFRGWQSGGWWQRSPRSSPWWLSGGCGCSGWSILTALGEHRNRLRTIHEVPGGAEYWERRWTRMREGVGGLISLAGRAAVHPCVDELSLGDASEMGACGVATLATGRARRTQPARRMTFHRLCGVNGPHGRSDDGKPNDGLSVAAGLGRSSQMIIWFHDAKNRCWDFLFASWSQNVASISSTSGNIFCLEHRENCNRS